MDRRPKFGAYLAVGVNLFVNGYCGLIQGSASTGLLIRFFTSLLVTWFIASFTCGSLPEIYWKGKYKTDNLKTAMLTETKVKVSVHRQFKKHVVEQVPLTNFTSRR